MKRTIRTILSVAALTLTISSLNINSADASSTANDKKVMRTKCIDPVFGHVGWGSWCWIGSAACVPNPCEGLIPKH